LRELNPEVLVVTGDHSTPSLLKSHSWHPVPALLWSSKGFARQDGVMQFGEQTCIRGNIGRMPMKNILLIAMANAERFKKFGA
jgi:2,3-bisphosphoglycerate-independent phosphoglycerate mutase